MKRITIDLVSQDSIDPRTNELRYSHSVMSRWLTTTQTWKWRGGDAVVVLTEDGYGRPDCWVALRLGKQFHAVCAPSVSAALAAFGYESKVKVRHG